MPQSAVITCYGELLLRATAAHGVPLANAQEVRLCVGGAEANVAATLSGFGHDVQMMTAVPQDNPLSDLALGVLRGYGVGTANVVSGAGRLGLYFLEPGAGRKPSHILYDRQHSVFSKTIVEKAQWRDLLQGMRLLHISGVTPAVSAICAENAATACEVAAQNGVIVSYDYNHRAQLWALWQGDPTPYLNRILNAAKIVFANDYDFASVLPAAPRPDNPRSLSLSEAVFDAFPTIKLLATAARTIKSVDHHQLTAHLATRHSAFQSAPLDLPGIVDRIGGGDAFAAGILDAYLNDKSLEEAAELALGASAYKHYVAGDAVQMTRHEALQLSSKDAVDVKR